MADQRVTIGVQDEASASLDRIAAAADKVDRAFASVQTQSAELAEDRGPERFSDRTVAGFAALSDEAKHGRDAVAELKHELDSLPDSREIRISTPGMDKAIAQSIALNHLNNGSSTGPLPSSVRNSLDPSMVNAIDQLASRPFDRNVGASNMVGGGGISSSFVNGAQVSDRGVIEEIRGLRSDLKGYASNGGNGSMGAMIARERGAGNLGGGGGIAGLLGGAIGAGEGGGGIASLALLGAGLIPGAASVVGGLGATLGGGVAAAGVGYASAIPAMIAAQVAKQVLTIGSKPVVSAISGASSMLQSVQQMQIADPQQITSLKQGQAQQQILTQAQNQQTLAALTASGQGPGTEAYAQAVGQMEMTARTTGITNAEAITQARQQQKLAISQARQAWAQGLQQTYGIDPTMALNVARRTQGLQMQFGRAFGGGERGQEQYGLINQGLTFAGGAGMNILGNQWDQIFPAASSVAQGAIRGLSSRGGQADIASATSGLPSIVRDLGAVATNAAKLGGVLTQDFSGETGVLATGLANWLGTKEQWASSSAGISSINASIQAASPVWSGFAGFVGAVGKGLDTMLVGGGGAEAARFFDDMTRDVPGIVNWMDQGIGTLNKLGPLMSNFGRIVRGVFGGQGDFGSALSILESVSGLLGTITRLLGPTGSQALLAGLGAERLLHGGGGGASGALGLLGFGRGGGAAGAAESSVSRSVEMDLKKSGLFTRLAGGALGGLSSISPLLAVGGLALASSGGSPLEQAAGYGATGLGTTLMGVKAVNKIGAYIARRAAGSVADAAVADGGEAALVGGVEATGAGLDASVIGAPAGLAIGAAGLAIPFIAKLLGGSSKKAPAATPLLQAGSITSAAQLSQYLNQSFTTPGVTTPAHTEYVNSRTGQRMSQAPPGTFWGMAGQQLPPGWTTQTVGASTSASSANGYGTPLTGYDSKAGQTSAQANAERTALSASYKALQTATAQTSVQLGTILHQYDGINAKLHQGNLSTQNRNVLLGQQKSLLSQMASTDPLSVRYNDVGQAVGVNRANTNLLLGIRSGAAGASAIARTQNQLSTQRSALQSAITAAVRAAPVGMKGQVEAALAFGNLSAVPGLMQHAGNNPGLHAALSHYSAVAQGGTFSDVNEQLQAVGTSIQNLTGAQRAQERADLRIDRSFGSAYNTEVRADVAGHLGGAALTGATGSASSASAGSRAQQSGRAMADQTAKGLESGKPDVANAAKDVTTTAYTALGASQGTQGASSAASTMVRSFATALTGGAASDSQVNTNAKAIVSTVLQDLGSQQGTTGATSAGANLIQSFATGLRDSASGSAGDAIAQTMFQLGMNIVQQVAAGAHSGGGRHGGGLGATSTAGGFTKFAGLHIASAAGPRSNAGKGVGSQGIPVNASAGEKRFFEAANDINSRHYNYEWGGGHNATGTPTSGHGANGSGPGVGYDCSGSLSAVLMAAGWLSAPQTASQFMHGPGQAGDGGPNSVTWWASPKHVICRVGTEYFGTSLQYNPGGGAGWFHASAGYGHSAVAAADPGGGVAVRHISFHDLAHGGGHKGGSNVSTDVAMPAGDSARFTAAVTAGTRRTAASSGKVKSLGSSPAVPASTSFTSDTVSSSGTSPTSMASNSMMGSGGGVGARSGGSSSQRPIIVQVIVQSLQTSTGSEYAKFMTRFTSDLKQATRTALNTGDEGI
jgi:hypothetical protein